MSPAIRVALRSTSSIKSLRLRLLAIVFALLILALQYPLWLGKGGWLRVRELNSQVEAQKDVNIGLKARNAALDAEVRDLKQGTEAIEERARYELGMVRQDEVFFQVEEKRHEAKPSPAPAVRP